MNIHHSATILLAVWYLAVIPAVLAMHLRHRREERQERQRKHYDRDAPADLADPARFPWV